MTTTDLTTTTGSTALTIAAEQDQFNDRQLATLRHLGVDNASEGDLAVFFHVAKRTGLDPFARQIYMIGRNTKDQKTNQWVTKYTIQTGIDGYRLIGRRAANAARVRIGIGAPQWAGADGVWRDLWLGGAENPPAAARVTITRDGEPFTAVALFDEYKQTVRDGALTSMWRQRPAGQIAKCAEALAWRMAFPQDLAGIYVEDELQHATNPDPAPAPAKGAVTGAEILGELEPTPAAPAEDVVDAEVIADTPALITAAQFDELLRVLDAAGLGDRHDALATLREVTNRGDDLRGPGDLTTDQAQTVIDTLTAVTAAAPR